MQPESAAFLWDVRAAGVRITTFADGLTAASYAADELRKSAVERQLEIIGEALNRLRKADPEVAQRIPDISRIIATAGRAEPSLTKLIRRTVELM